MITFCGALILAGVLLLVAGTGGTFGLKIPQLGYIGGPTGLILMILGVLLQLKGVC